MKYILGLLLFPIALAKQFVSWLAKITGLIYRYDAYTFRRRYFVKKRTFDLPGHKIFEWELTHRHTHKRFKQMMGMLTELMEQNIDIKKEYESVKRDYMLRIPTSSDYILTPENFKRYNFEKGTVNPINEQEQ